MDHTALLNLPYIMAAQAQKHVTHNEAIRALDALVQLSVQSRTQAVPPPTPSDGERYIIAPSATGGWSGKDGQIASWQDNLWIFYQPQQGWLCWVSAENKLLAWQDTAWLEVSGGIGLAALRSA